MVRVSVWRVGVCPVAGAEISQIRQWPERRDPVCEFRGETEILEREIRKAKEPPVAVLARAASVTKWMDVVDPWCRVQDVWNRNK